MRGKFAALLFAVGTQGQLERHDYFARYLAWALEYNTSKLSLQEITPIKIHTAPYSKYVITEFDFAYSFVLRA